MTNRTPVVAEYLALAKNEDLEGATAYLKECFTNEDGETLDEEAMTTFMETVVAAAEAETKTETETTEEACDVAEEVEVQEADTDS